MVDDVSDQLNVIFEDLPNLRHVQGSTMFSSLAVSGCRSFARATLALSNDLLLSLMPKHLQSMISESMPLNCRLNDPSKYNLYGLEDINMDAGALVNRNLRNRLPPGFVARAAQLTILRINLSDASGVP